MIHTQRTDTRELSDTLRKYAMNAEGSSEKGFRPVAYTAFLDTLNESANVIDELARRVEYLEPGEPVTDKKVTEK